MADKDQILANAKAWFARQNIPKDCPAQNCSAVNKWELGEVAGVVRTEYDKDLGHGRRVRNPELYLVSMYCGWCGHTERTYEEEVPLDD